MKVVTGFILGWVVLAVAALLLVYSGVYDVAASKPENAITAWLFSTTMRRSVARHADAAAVPGHRLTIRCARGSSSTMKRASTAMARPGKIRWTLAGAQPEPPYLSDTVSRWTAPELFWIVKNGIRMTGMPAFGGTHSDAELKAAVFIQRLPTMTLRNTPSSRSCSAHIGLGTGVV